MELAKIEALLEQYFEGNTSLQEEARLQEYFTTAEVPDHLAPYKDMFAGFALMQTQESHTPVQLPQEEKKRNPFWGYAAAAVIGVLLSIGLFMNSGNGTEGTETATLTPEQQEAMIAFEEAKKALQMMSGNLNDGIEEMAYLSEFEKATNQIFK